MRRGDRARGLPDLHARSGLPVSISAGAGIPNVVDATATAQDSKAAAGLPALVFVSQRRSGASRRMASLVAWIKVTQKKRLRVIDVDADRNPAIADGLRVRKIPSLVLIKDRRVVGRLEGRATGRQIDELIRPHLG